MVNNLREVVGLMLWWAEGTKPRKDKRWKNAISYIIEITNTDPTIVKLFLKFLRKDIKINENRLKLQLQIHADNNADECKKYWSKITDIPIRRFNKVIIRPPGKKLGKTRGTCKIRYCDKPTYLLLLKKLRNIINQI